ncbi:MAG: hypothetical protein IIA60_10115 [Candidatus Marinimicrobia bacterium]|nr:hypothetical protein [Candidatus Neomarinimicrobiota bacterium]
MESIRFLPLIIFVSMVFWTCADQEDPADTKHPDEIVGTWNQTSAEFDIIITTNSDQILVDQFAEGNGSISITGAHTTTLTYLSFYTDSNFVSVFAAEFGPLDLEDANYFLSLAIIDGKSSAFFIANISSESPIFYNTSDLNFSIDLSTYTVAVDNIQFYTADSSAGITADGTLAAATINIPANVPTSVPFNIPESEYQITLVFNADGTVIDLEDSTYSTTDTWEVENGVMTIISTYSDDGETFIDTVEFDYTLDAGELALMMEGDLCEDFIGFTQEECLEIYESLWLLTSGSLIAARISVSLTFSRAAAKRIATAGNLRAWPLRRTIQKELVEAAKRQIIARKR